MRNGGLLPSILQIPSIRVWNPDLKISDPPMDIDTTAITFLLYLFVASTPRIETIAVHILDISTFDERIHKTKRRIHLQESCASVVANYLSKMPYHLLLSMFPQNIC